MMLFKPNIRKIQEKKDLSGLIKALSYRDPSVREAAASALGELNDPHATEPLISALKDDDPTVRISVTAALGRIKDPRAILPLILACKGVGDHRVRLATERALDQLACAESIDALVYALKNSSPFVRATAASLLAKTEDARSVAPLIEALRDEVRFVFNTAVAALRQIRGAKVEEAFVASAATWREEARRRGVRRGADIAQEKALRESELEAYERAIELDPSREEAWYGKALVLGELQRHPDSLVAANKAIELKPDSGRAWNMKGIALTAKAMSVISIRIDGTGARADVSVLEEALKAFDKAVQLDNNPVFVKNRDETLGLLKQKRK